MTKFEEQFEKLAEAARERFEREGSHDHLIYLVSLSTEKPGLQEVPFWAIINAMPGRDIHAKKEMAYRTVASMMVKRELPGYVEVGEFWIALLGGDQDVFSRYNQILKKHGSIANMPGRNEILMISGRYGQETNHHHWKIGRREKEVWLEDGTDAWEPGLDIAKSSVLDRTSVELAGNHQ